LQRNLSPAFLFLSISLCTKALSNLCEWKICTVVNNSGGCLFKCVFNSSFG